MKANKNAADDAANPNPSPRRTQGPSIAIPDWQVVEKISEDCFYEVDQHTGRKRKIEKSRCCCGQPVLIEREGNLGRGDGKRVFYPDEPDLGWDAFRCKSCHAPVSESVPGAEYEK
ncbi:hypothetical protein [Geoalkalibacter subterraneus]|uniref:Uncharacterized protein n=1 Tax=Geoalkalibacter subterraneus TaxID=483547 RepID=A0A0B5FU81_9BACT|nr:hypothetical protein [Geoalkalibacter subterraneus]AJF08214.1 hypothetical protein GSUB_17140 [Geoalkalibacter subterraneus]